MSGFLMYRILSRRLGGQPRRLYSSSHCNDSSLFPAGDMHPIPSIVPWTRLHSARIEVRMATDPSPSRSVCELFCRILGEYVASTQSLLVIRIQIKKLKKVMMCTPVPCDKYNTCDSFTV